jgi:predicted DNA-binding transcriptional regulator AlpA
MKVAKAMAREKVLYQTFLAQPVRLSPTSIYRLMERKNQPKPLKASSAILVERRSEEKDLFAALA